MLWCMQAIIEKLKVRLVFELETREREQREAVEAEEAEEAAALAVAAAAAAAEEEEEHNEEEKEDEQARAAAGEQDSERGQTEQAGKERKAVKESGEEEKSSDHRQSQDEGGEGAARVALAVDEESRGEADDELQGAQGAHVEGVEQWRRIETPWDEQRVSVVEEFLRSLEAEVEVHPGDDVEAGGEAKASNLLVAGAGVEEMWVTRLRVKLRAFKR